MSVERAAGLQSCIPYRNFEKMKLNIWINIVNKSPIENIYLHNNLIFQSAAIQEILTLLGLKID
jgi:hypothetical protein